MLLMVFYMRFICYVLYVTLHTLHFVTLCFNGHTMLQIFYMLIVVSNVSLFYICYDIVLHIYGYTCCFLRNAS